jgi:hypothetical protein
MKLIRMLPALLAGALVAASLEAAPGLKVIEQAIETSTYVVSLPDGSNGSMAVKSCPQCKPVLLRLTPRSTFLVGGGPVKYSEFVALARGGGEHSLNIFYDRKSGTITRLLMKGVRRPPTRAVSRQ